MSLSSPSCTAYHAAANLDLDSIDEIAISDIIPLLYFTVADIELLILDKISDYYLLQKSTEQIQLLDSLCSTNFELLWKEGLSEYRKRSHLGHSNTRNPYVCSDFELQTSAEAKLKLVVQQLCHLLLEPCTSDCLIRRCCSILESPTLISQVVSCIVALIYALSQPSFLSDIICGLSAHCSHAARGLIRLLLLNFPHFWPAVWKRLLEVSVSADQQNQPISVTSSEGLAASKARSSPLRDCRASRALATLRYATTFMPQTEYILDHCISLHCLPDFLLQLALSLHQSEGNDLLGFFRRIFFDEGRDTCEWFGNYLKTLSDTDPSLAIEVNSRLLSIGLSLSSDSKTAIPKDKLILALEFLRVVAALRGFADFPLTPEIRQSILQLIIRPTSINERAVNFICYALAFSVGMRSCFMDSNTAPFSVDNSSIESEEHLVTWLHRLLNRQDVIHAALRPSSSGAAPNSYSQLLLLLALLFHTNQQSAIRELVADVLGVDAPCLARNISASRKLFTQKVFTEQLIAAQAAHVPVTVSLNAHMAGHLPIHCVHQLLRSHTFNKNRVQIKGWIYRQICESVRPLHPLLPELVEAYVASCLNFTPRAGVAISLPFTESELLHQFSAPVAGPAACICSPAGLPASVAPPVSDSDARHDLTPQLLFLYYLLFIYDQELMTRVAETDRRQQTQAVSLFSDKLWDAIPVTFLLQYARSHMSDYRKFYPRLLQLVTNHLPHLTVGELMIQDELLLDPFWQSTYTASPRQFANPSGSDTFSLLDISGPPATTSSMSPALPSPTNLAAALDTVIASDAETRTVAVRRVIFMLHRLYAATRTRNLSSTSSSSDGPLSSSLYFRLLLPYVDCLTTKMPLALLQDASICGNRRFGRICCSLWRSLHTVMPQRLGVLTIGALTPPQTKIVNAPIPGFIAPETLTRRDLLTDPVERIVMGVDRRVYRCPPVLHIVLRILECNLLASRSFWAHRVADRHFPTPPPSALTDTGIITVPPPVQSSPPSLLPITSPTTTTADALPTLSAQFISASALSAKDLTKGLKRKKSSSSSSSTPNLGDSLPVKVSTAGLDCAVPATAGVSQSPLPQLPQRSVPPPLSETSDPLRRSSFSRAGTPQPPQTKQPVALVASDEECDRLRAALVLSQDATVVQLLLEFCLPIEEEKESKSEITELREVQNIICTFIHYLFIAEPSLANVVFWQTYPRSIIPVAVRSIPSIHICMDSVIDVFRLSGNFESMVFCLDFVSHLALHYNIRALLDRTAYLIEGMHQIFTNIVSVEELPPLLLACLPPFCRIACAFPSLSPRIATIMLTSLSMIVNAAAAVTKDHERMAACLLQSLRKPYRPPVDSDAETMNVLEEADDCPDLSEMNISDQFTLACTRTLRMFDRMVTLACAQRRLYGEPQADFIV
uniref:Integrator complex subunit 2 n=1 Tax=Schistocephalus solidus TaxID=70667 RepID=A0A0X3P3D8_SCHSO